NDVWHGQAFLEHVVRLANPRTRIILNTYSRMWEPVLAIAQAIGLSKPSLQQNWLTVEDMTGLLHPADDDVIRSSARLLRPLPLPILATVANRYLVKLWPFRLFALTSVMVAHRRPQITSRHEPPIVSVVVPARNEAGNIPRILAEVPEMGAGTELIFVEGGSTDDTYGAIEREIVNHPARWCRLL